MAITGKWQDGASLLAVPYYARWNRLEKSGDSSVSKVWIGEEHP
jgi:hypothetical protein